MLESVKSANKNQKREQLVIRPVILTEAAFLTASDQCQIDNNDVGSFRTSTSAGTRQCYALCAVLRPKILPLQIRDTSKPAATAASVKKMK